MALARPKKSRLPQESEVITLPYKFEPREYQYPVLRYYDETPNRQRAFLLAHRRTGKDLLAWNILVKETQKRVGTYWHVLPLLNQARKIIWTGSTKDGIPFLDFIPPPLIASKRDDDMSIRLTNGSLIQLVGADRIDSLMGSNPVGVNLSEFALMKPSVWDYLSPILNENDGWANFITTPRGRNHAFDLFKSMVDAANNKGAKYFVQVLTVDDTRKPLLDDKGEPIYRRDGSPVMVPIMSPEAIQEQRDLNIPEEIIQQEYYCSFEAGMVGSYYSEAISKLEKEGRAVKDLSMYNPDLPVYTAWDIGFSDSMSIWYFQIEKKRINVIEYNEFVGRSLIECCHIVNAKWDKLREECGWADDLVSKTMALYQHHENYSYKTHFGPHDLDQTDISIGVTRRSVAKQHGLKFRLVPRTDVQSGIDLVRRILINCHFELTRTNDGLRALKEYHKEWNESKQMYEEKPCHDWSSHGADGFRYLAQAVVTFIDRSMDKKVESTALHDYDPLEERMKKYDRNDDEKPKGRLRRHRVEQFAVVDYNLYDY
jgi:hypothetical protein